MRPSAQTRKLVYCLEIEVEVVMVRQQPTSVVHLSEEQGTRNISRMPGGSHTELYQYVATGIQKADRDQSWGTMI